MLAQQVKREETALAKSLDGMQSKRKMRRLLFGPGGVLRAERGWHLARRALGVERRMMKAPRSGGDVPERGLCQGL